LCAQYPRSRTPQVHHRITVCIRRTSGVLARLPTRMTLLTEQPSCSSINCRRNHYASQTPPRRAEPPVHTQDMGVLTQPYNLSLFRFCSTAYPLWQEAAQEKNTGSATKHLARNPADFASCAHSARLARGHRRVPDAARPPTYAIGTKIFAMERPHGGPRRGLVKATVRSQAVVLGRFGRSGAVFLVTPYVGRKPKGWSA